MSVAKGLSIYGNGVDLAQAFKSFSSKATVQAHDATVLGSNARQYAQGYIDGGASSSGVWDFDATNLNKINNVLQTAFGNQSAVVLTVSLATLAVGGRAILIDGTIENLSIETPLDELIMTGADFKTSNGLGLGVWLMAGTVTNTTTNGASVDNGAATANGGIGHAHIQNSSGNDVNVVWQHSTNNSTWVDLIETDISGTINAASIAVAAGTTVNRYLRAVVTTTGGGSLVIVAFARK